MLRSATILGREVPLVAVMANRALAARADILLTIGGALVVGDYKLSRHGSAAPVAEYGYEVVVAEALGTGAIHRNLLLDSAS